MKRKDAIKEYANKGCYIVDNYITNDVGGTNLWFVFESYLRAVKWIDSCKKYYTGDGLQDSEKEGLTDYKFMSPNGTTHRFVLQPI